jgi:hypothetical protein
LTRRKGRPSKSTSAARSPFDPGLETLTKAIGEAQGDGGTFVAWLPTTGDGPVASTSIVAEPPADGTSMTLAPWLVSGLRLPVGRAIDLLLAASGQATLTPGVMVGQTLSYWADALRFAGALVARQRFLPVVEKIEGTAKPTHRARWSPITLGLDAPRLARLAKVMPHAARALTLAADRDPEPPSTSASSVLDAFLAEVVDHLVRTSPHRNSKPKAEFESLHDQWLDALGTTEGSLTGDARELDRLVEQVREWRRQIALAASSPFRLGFRLE